MAVAVPHDQRMGCEVAQRVGGELLESADEGLAVAVAGGESVGSVLGAARDGVARWIEQDVDGRQQQREGDHR